MIQPKDASDGSSASSLLKMVGIEKSFRATRALRGVSLEAYAGEVLAIIGENGAGKSTLMKVLSGAHAPDAGEMYLDGIPYLPRHPMDARRHGIAMIYQELNLAPDLSVEDNIMLGVEEKWAGWVRWGAQRHKVRAALELLGHPDLKPQREVGSLSVGAQQLVEIARALVSDSRVILFDEPTSSLPRADVERLFSIIRRLKGEGIAIVYISHFLEEIRAIADRYSVLRDGSTAGNGRLDEITNDQIVSLMVGRSVDALFPKVPHSLGDVRLKVDGLQGDPIPIGTSLTLRRGEIFGLFGLVGAGRSRTLRTLFGLDRIRKGVVEWDGRTLGRSIRRRIVQGLGLVSEDRKSEGLAQSLSIEDNLTLSHLSPYSVCGWILRKKRRTSSREWMTRLAIKARNPQQEIRQLSGGNQQKVAIGRVLHQGADLLLLDEPTKGIDVGTKSEIYRWIGQLASEGKSIVFVSSYLPELLAVCDTLGVMARGRLKEVRRVSDWTEEQAMRVAVDGLVDFTDGIPPTMDAMASRDKS